MTTYQPSGLRALLRGAVQSPFASLRQLLDGIAPKQPPIDLALGEPHEPPPPFLLDRLREAGARFSDYPAIRGSDALRLAIADWLALRYRLNPVRVDPAANVLPINGSREGLFYATLASVGCWRGRGKPAVLMPNPCYPAYYSSALAANAEPVPLTARPAAGHLPDLTALEKDPALLARTALLILCSPSNPEGAVADRAYLATAIDLARKHNFFLLVDECYSEIYDSEPPPGALEVAAMTTGNFDNVVVVNSLSKRSSVPGLRSGFCAGDRKFIDRLAMLRNVVGPQMPGPIQHASAAIWSDEAHVERTRAAYRSKFDLADRILGTRFGYRRPAGGFFLWLDLAPQGGEAAARVLWREAGVRVLPGAYMTYPDAAGCSAADDFVRVALVRDLPTSGEALSRLAEIMEATWQTSSSPSRVRA
jgi:N-succinyldiaminopimelate aminotransferase